MLRPALQLQISHQCFYFIADYHALTITPSPLILRENILDLVAIFGALGMDFKNHIFFQQSAIPEVTELQWILSCVSPKALLERAHAYKDATVKEKEISMGLFNYPILMAADILLYDIQVVPVGKDQKQHIEIARDIAIKFNHIYGEIFVVPEALIAEDVAVIPGIDGQKMSKSYDNVVPLFSSEKQLRKRILQIVTNSTPIEAPKNPDTCNVFQLFKCFATPEETVEMRERYLGGNFGYGTAKQICFEVINRTVGPLRERYEDLRNDEPMLKEILRDGQLKASLVATGVIQRVREAVGIAK